MQLISRFKLPLIAAVFLALGSILTSQVVYGGGGGGGGGYTYILVDSTRYRCTRLGGGGKDSSDFGLRSYSGSKNGEDNK